MPGLWGKRLKDETMIRKIDNISSEQLVQVRRTIGEAFVSNELFHNWGNESERYTDVLRYMSIYVDYVYRAEELYANEDMTGFIGLEDSAHAPVLPRIRMILRMFAAIPYGRIKSFLHFVSLIRGHIQTRAVENVCYILTCNTAAEFQTAPTGIYDRSGRILTESVTGEEGLLIYDLEDTPLNFGEAGRKMISDSLKQEKTVSGRGKNHE